MMFLSLLRSILLVCLLVHPIGLTVMGLLLTLRTGKTDGLFAVLATPMTLAFFGPPALIWCLVLILPTYYVLSWFGRRNLTPLVIGAVGVALFLHLALRDPVPTGAIPGYDQSAEGVTAACFVGWAMYAYFRMDLGASRAARTDGVRADL